MSARHKCFISYHHADQLYVDHFVKTFDHAHDCFLARGLGEAMAGDIIQSNDTGYILNRIRQLYVADSTVTIVMLGENTWGRRYVDWEIATSLRNSVLSNANGLLGIKLPTFQGNFPPRFNDNLIPPGSQQTDCYARHMDWPPTITALEDAVEGAFERRATHAGWIQNGRERMTNDRTG